MSQDLTTARHNNFSTLRMLFASLVICSHSFELVDGNRSREIMTRIFGTISFGALAVDGFFLVSGYLITKSFLQSNRADYLIKRVLRIYPGYIAAFIISIAVAELSVNQNSGLNGEFFRDNLFNLFFLMGPVVKNAYPNTYYQSVDGVTWTISYEFHCYLMIFFLGVFGLLRKRYFILVVTLALMSVWLIHPDVYVKPIYNSSHVAIAAAGTIYQYHSFFRLLRGAIFENHSFDIKLFGMFLVGSCFYLFRDVVPFQTRYVIVAAALFLGCLFSNRLAEPGLAVFGGNLLFWFALKAKPLSVSKFFNTTDLSYGTYLYGWPVQKNLMRLFPSIDPYSLCLMTLCLSPILAFLSWNLIEKPCLDLKDRLSFFSRTPAKVKNA